ncbi:MAG: hypothetical protein GTO14_11615 [Anaerolineales bacterium]|nr:hypothetical protein [Anaerolineales bacterium]
MHCPDCGQIHTQDSAFCSDIDRPKGRARRSSIRWVVLALSFLWLLVTSDTFSTTSTKPSSLSAPQPSPATAIPSQTSAPIAETIEQALRSVHRVKVRFDANVLEPTGDKIRILSGTAQFKSQDEELEPLSYFLIKIEEDIASNSSIEFYFTHDKASVRGLAFGDHWLTLPVTDSPLDLIPSKQGLSNTTREHPYTFLAFFTGIPAFGTGNTYPVAGLPLSSGNPDETWQAAGQITINNQLVSVFNYRTVDGADWNKILPRILKKQGIIESVSSELWVGAADSLPYLIRYTLDLHMGTVLGLVQIEINLYPYDFNQPLDLPSDLPS